MLILRKCFLRLAFILGVFAWAMQPSIASAADPIKFGMGAQLSGPLAGNGRAMIVAMEIWAEEVNAKGGILGRPVELVYYDDQSNPGNVPLIYTKLLTVDDVDILMGMSTNLIAPVLPMVIQKKRLIMAMFAIGLNRRFEYPRFFQMQPFGPNGEDAMTRGFFEVIRTLDPAPKTIGLIGADAEFAKTILDGARATAKELGLEVVYDEVYPPNSVDLTPVLRSLQAAKPEIVMVASYPADSVNIIRGAKEIGLQARMFGGAMVGLQYAAVKTQLGSDLNGVFTFDIYTPAPALQFDGTKEFLEKYQARAAAEGTDALGFYGPLFAYASMQVLEQAITQADTLDEGKIAEVLHAETFKTIVGDVKFGKDGEWAKPRILGVQFQGLEGGDIEQFRQPGHEIVNYPPEYKSGEPIFPYPPQ